MKLKHNPRGKTAIQRWQGLNELATYYAIKLNIPEITDFKSRKWSDFLADRMGILTCAGSQVVTETDAKYYFTFCDTYGCKATDRVEIAIVAIHKARTMDYDVPEDLRNWSKKWLKVLGFTDLDWGPENGIDVDLIEQIKDQDFLNRVNREVE